MLFTMAATINKNEKGPNFVGYYNYLLSEVYLKNEDNDLSSLGSDLEPLLGYSDGKTKDLGCENNGHEGKSSGRFVSFFERIIGEELSDYKKERLKAVVHQSAICLNQEANEILGQILATLKSNSDTKEKELLSSYSNASAQVMSESLSRRKRKSCFSDHDLGSISSLCSLKSGRKVQNDTQAIQGSGEIREETVQKYSCELLEKVSKMEEDVEEFLNSVLSKCRQMTDGEIQKLGRQIQKLPGKALDRVAEIIRLKDPSASNLSDNIVVNLEQQDNATLWRLYYYVRTVAKANHP